MPPRSSWKGYLRLSLVSVPVQAFTASVSGGGEIHLNQLHAECNSRIRYKKVCPIHGEVSNDEIVSGYEYAKGQYVVVDPDELARLRQESDRAINIDTFIKPEQLDPIYYEGRTYYLVPDGPVGQKPYAVLYAGLEEQNRYGIARAVFSGKDQLVLLRPLDRLLVLTMLAYESQVRAPSAFHEELIDSKVTAEELRLAETLIKASSTDKFDFARYEDQYTSRLTELIEAKVAGKEIVAPPAAEEEDHVINLMDALRKSVQQATGGKRGAATAGKRTGKPGRKMAASKGRDNGRLKRKSS
jgi:DNA end-binding protein Ku